MWAEARLLIAAREAACHDARRAGFECTACRSLRLGVPKVAMDGSVRPHENSFEAQL